MNDTKFIKIYQWMFNLNLTLTDIFVYSYLLGWREYYDNNNGSVPIEITRRTKNEILEVLKISQKSFHNAIEKLCSKKYIIKWSTPNKKIKNFKLYSAVFPPKSLMEPKIKLNEIDDLFKNL